MIDWMSHLGFFGAIVVRGNICARMGSAEKILSASVSSPLSFPFFTKKRRREKEVSARGFRFIISFSSPFERFYAQPLTTNTSTRSYHHRLPNIKTPDYLDGTIPGDYGFDPLGLGSDPERLKYYQEAELMNARWAMMAVAGICTTEALGIQSKWYMAGQEDYGFPINAQLAVLFPTMGFLETKRITGWLATGKSGINETFPFDPLGMGADNETMKLKEIKNGRAAMIAFVGICVQALVLREGPLAALQDHVANPFGNNLATNVMNLPINLA